jgi:hypothetical protein
MSSHVGLSSQEVFRKKGELLQTSLRDNLVKRHGF